MMVADAWKYYSLTSAALFAFFLIVVLVLILVVLFSLPRRIRFQFSGKHAFITGGSKGIGKAIAAELIARGCATVSIAARDEVAMKAAVEELDASKGEDGRMRKTKVYWYKMDVTWNYEKISEVFRQAEAVSGPIDLLVNNAGVVVQGAFEEIPIDGFEKQMQTNYLSAVYASRAVVEGMKRRGGGHLAFVSSAAGQCAVWGYTAYSPSKFALRGLADALRMELRPYNINVSVLFPPNTQTEGFVEEQRTMPEEVRLISGAAGLFPADHVARQLVDTIGRGSTTTTIGFEGWMLGTLTAGATSETNGLQVVAEILLGGILRGVMLIYLGMFDRIVGQCHRRKQREQTSSSTSKVE